MRSVRQLFFNVFSGPDELLDEMTREREQSRARGPFVYVCTLVCFVLYWLAATSAPKIMNWRPQQRNKQNYISSGYFKSWNVVGNFRVYVQFFLLLVLIRRYDQHFRSWITRGDSSVNKFDFDRNRTMKLYCEMKSKQTVISWIPFSFINAETRFYELIYSLLMRWRHGSNVPQKTPVRITANPHQSDM